MHSQPAPCFLLFITAVFLVASCHLVANPGNASAPGEEIITIEVNRSVFFAMRQAQQISGQRQKSPNLIESIIKAILADATVDDGERNALEKLGDPAFPSFQLVAVPRDSIQPFQFINNIAPSALAEVSELLNPPNEHWIRQTSLWSGELNDRTTLYREFLGDDSLENSLRYFITAQATKAWAASLQQKSFRPFREFMGDAYAGIQSGHPQLTEEEKLTGFRLLHAAIATVPENEATGAAPPPAHLYEWIASAKPVAHTPPAPRVDEPDGW